MPDLPISQLTAINYRFRWRLNYLVNVQGGVTKKQTVQRHI